jgi:outer membrane protein
MVIKRFVAVLPLLWTGFPSAAAASGGEPLTLADAMARGRAQSREVAAAGARSAAADARAREARGHRLPTLRLSESWIRTDSPADAFGLLLNQERFSFPSFVSGNPNAPDPLETAITRVELELPVWTGGEISTRVAQARLAAEAAASSATRAGDAAALAAGDAWLGLLQAREHVELLGRARATVAAHAELARAYSTQGMIVRSELLRAEVELARLDDLLAEARRGAEVAEAHLAFRLAEPLGGRYALATLGEVEGELEPLAVWLARTDERPDLAAARSLLAAGELEERAIRAGLRPRIGLVARHDWTDDALFGTHGSATTIAAAATLDLFDGGRRRAAAAAARAEAEAGRRDVESFAAGVALEVRQAHAAALAARARRATARAALAAAAEALRIVEERFRGGLLKTLDVLDAATARREAETRELVARVDAHAALLRLGLAAGVAPESLLDALPPSTHPPGDPS